MTQIIFILFSLAALGSSAAAVTRREPIHAVLFLVAALCATAGLFVLLGAYLVAALQVMIYAGAIIVLFLFVLMLVQGEDLLRGRFPGFSARWAAPAVALILAVVLIGAIARGGGGGHGAAGAMVGSAERIGRSLFSRYLLPFEVASILLLVAVLGAVVLGRKGES